MEETVCFDDSTMTYSHPFKTVELLDRWQQTMFREVL